MLIEIQQLGEQIKRDYPSSNPKFTPFPSGAAMLDVEIGPETYVMEYLPSLHAVGLSRRSAATFGWEGFEHPFDSFENAKQFLLSLLKEGS
jgi:hypothetical protein